MSAIPRKISRTLKADFFSIIGLSLSLSTCFLILYIISFHLSFDKIHENRERIYRISMNLMTGGDSEDHYATTGQLLGPDLAQNYPSISEFASFKLWDGPGRIESGQLILDDLKIYAASNNVLNIFSYSLLEGSDKALNSSKSLVISEDIAFKLFGENSALNKTVLLDSQEFTITGIMSNLSESSNLKFDVLTSVSTAIPEEEILQSFFNIDHFTYILAETNSTQEDISQSLSIYASEYLNPLIAEAGAELSVSFAATRLDKLHFSDPLMMDTPKSNMDQIYILLALAILLLFIGTTNYLNTVLTQTYKKATKIGMQRVFGVGKAVIRMSFFRRSVLVVAFSFVISLLIVYFCITGIDLFSTVRFTPDISQIVMLCSGLIFLLLLLGSIGGIIPANQMCSKNPAELLKERGALISINSWNQRTILFLQFAISLALIAGSIELYRQFAFFSNKSLGFDDKNVVVINVPPEANNNIMRVFRQNLLQHAEIGSVSLTRTVPGDEPGQEIFGLTTNGVYGEAVFNYQRVDEHYFEVLGITVNKGRVFDRDSDRDALMVNQAFTRNYSGSDPFAIQMEMDTIKSIIGLVNDYHQLSFHNPIEPMVFGRLNLESDPVNKVLVRAGASSLPLIRNTWEELGLNHPLGFYFLQDHFNGQYANEATMLRLFVVSALISIALCCFGLLSLVALSIKNRKKEFAIRQILGGSLKNIFILMSKPYLITLGVVFVSIIPIVIYFSQDWKNTYAYSAADSPVSYIVALLLVLLLISLIITYQLKRFEKINVITLIKE